MKRRTALTYSILTCIGIAIPAIGHQIPPQTTNSPTAQSAMSPVIIREPLTLQAWENDPNLPPLGVPIDPNRPISYALLSVTFENTTLNRIEIIINSVKIHSSKTNKVINSLPESRLILEPLEISAQQYRMSSRQSYGEHRTLIGSLTYTVAGQSYTLKTSETPVQ